MHALVQFEVLVRLKVVFLELKVLMNLKMGLFASTKRRDGFGYVLRALRRVQLPQPSIRPWGK